MDNLLSATVRVDSVEELEDKIKFKGGGKTYSFFRAKKDGGETAANRGWSGLGVKPGVIITVGYKETPYKDGHINSVLTVRAGEAAPTQNAVPRANSGATELGGTVSHNYRQVQPLDEFKPRNFDREAYEKCCSIWLAADLPRFGEQAINVPKLWEFYWEAFQAIRADGEKRFATGWEKAKVTFAPTVHTPPADDDEPPIEAFGEGM